MARYAGQLGQRRGPPPKLVSPLTKKRALKNPTASKNNQENPQKIQIMFIKIYVRSRK